MIRSRRAPIALAVLLLALHPAPVLAQCEDCGRQPGGGQGALLAANALLGGATAAVRAGVDGRPVLRAFAAGAAGGALTFAGKRIAVEEARGAGLLGRQVAALGSSISANVAEGRGPVDRLMVPAGPVRLYLSPRGGGPLVTARVDAAAVAAAAYAAVQPGARFDVEESLSSGALVFRLERGLGELRYEGRHAAGVVMVRDGGDPARVYRASVHERVHVLQYDQAFLLWSAPVEERLMRSAAWTRSLHRWADLGLNAPALAGVGALVPYRLQPWEAEAEHLSHVPAGPDQ
jgi:hypothetical protein